MMGPFFVKENGEYKLAECCEDCAFGDEHDCFLNECIAFAGYCEGYTAHQKDMEIEENDTHRRDHPVT